MSDNVTIVSDSRNFGDKSPEELDALLNAITPDGNLPDEMPVETPEEPAPEVPVDPPAEEPPAVDHEAELSALEKEDARISREKLEAALALQQAHSSRLAGEIGYLKEQLKVRPASEHYEPQSQDEMDRLTQTEAQLRALTSEITQNKVSQAIERGFGEMDGPWSAELANEIAAVVPKYQEQIASLKDYTDPTAAQQLARSIAGAVKLEAEQMKVAARRTELLQMKQAASADMAKAKKAQAPSASGGVPPPQAKPKTLADMTASEADAWLRSNVL